VGANNSTMMAELASVQMPEPLLPIGEGL